MKKIIYYTIPVILLIYIFDKIDMAVFKEILEKSNPYYMAAGFTVASFSMIIGSLRWIVLSGELNKKHKTFFIKHYWIGHAIGTFLPSSVGWDAYRVLSAGKQFGNYSFHVLIIMLEKTVTLITIPLLVISLYSVVAIVNHKELLDELYIYVLSIVIIFIIFSIFFVKIQKTRFANITFEKIRKIVIGWSEKYQIIKKIHYSNIKENFLKTFTKRNIIVALIFSLLIQANAALASHLFFTALNFDINYLVNLFVAPIMFLIFIMPISFGGMGVREVSYIGVYHLFGVPAEIALVVSFLAMTAMLLNTGIGGLIILLSKKDVIVSTKQS